MKPTKLVLMLIALFMALPAVAERSDDDDNRHGVEEKHRVHKGRDADEWKHHGGEKHKHKHKRKYKKSKHRHESDRSAPPRLPAPPTLPRPPLPDLPKPRLPDLPKPPLPPLPPLPGRD